MQVFLSDVHLTDGSSGQTINAGAFRVFADNLKALVKSVKQKSTVAELKIVLLGDIFDVIRSTRWLDEEEVRPWSDAGPAQEKAVLGIVKGILTNPENKKSLAYLRSLSQFARREKIDFELQYVMGNHDWLINRYPQCSKRVAAALGMSLAGSLPPFPSEVFDPAYRTLARHGDIYDKLNYMGNRDQSSIGDAIVVELLNRYPTEAERELNGLVAAGTLTAAERDRIVGDLREIDNIRPLLDAPSWILMVSNRTENDSARRAIQDAWQRCVDDFFKVPFIRKMDKPFWPDAIDMLQIALQLSSHVSKRVLETVVELKDKFLPTSLEGDYHKKAFAEAKVSSGEADFVLYGHTHNHLIVPMDQVPLSHASPRDRVYFNTGTWRQTWNKAAFSPAHREFIGWKVLTYVAFYNEDENHDYSFEVWNGALG